MQRKLTALSTLGSLLGLALFASPGAMAADDLTCRSCVGTQEIENGAVTRGKIAPGAINRARISNGAVNRDKLSNNAVSREKLRNAAVSTAKIRDDAVTGSKIAEGAVGAAHLGLARTHYVDAPGPGFDVDCRDLIGKLASLTGPAVVFLGPGVYDCGDQPVEVGYKVSLIGSGRNSTTITGSYSHGLVEADAGAKIANLTVINTNNTSGRAAGLVTDGVNAVVRDVSARGVDQGVRIENDCDGININGLYAIAESSHGAAIGFDCIDGAMTINNVVASSPGLGVGIANTTPTVVFRNSVIHGGETSLASGPGPTPIFVAISSQIDGPLDLDGGGTASCIGSFDGNYAPLDENCE